MSKSIYGGLTEEMIRRMRNWARWNAGSGVIGIGCHPMWRDTPRGPRGELPIGVISGEAGDTETAINSMPVRYAQAVKLFWQYEGKSLEYLSKRCSCDYRTYERRVVDGHFKLVGELARRADQERSIRIQFEMTQKIA